MRFMIAAACLVMAVGVSLAASDMAVITDSGSTNTAGFRIEVSRSGEAVYAATARRRGQLSEEQTKPRSHQIPGNLVKQFFADLDDAKSLSTLPGGGCMKSASFGTTLTVEYHDQKSPDLRCGDHGNSRLKALIQSTDEIIRVFNSQ
jgi:hypothetical protein